MVTYPADGVAVWTQTLVMPAIFSFIKTGNPEAVKGAVKFEVLSFNLVLNSSSVSASNPRGPR